VIFESPTGLFDIIDYARIVAKSSARLSVTIYVASHDGNRFAIVGEFQHGCVRVKFGSSVGDRWLGHWSWCGEGGNQQTHRSDLPRIVTEGHLSLFYRHSVVAVIEGKAIQREFPHVRAGGRMIYPNSKILTPRDLR
jgi:hypothetical protein